MSFSLRRRCRPSPALFPYTTLFRSYVPSTNGARNSPNAPFESENDPLETGLARVPDSPAVSVRSEEHTSELQSHSELVCRLLLEKKNQLFDAKHVRHWGTRTARGSQ